MKHIVSRMSSYFPNRWPLSYLNLTKNMKTYIRRQQHTHTKKKKKKKKKKRQFRARIGLVSHQRTTQTYSRNIFLYSFSFPIPYSFSLVRDERPGMSAVVRIYVSDFLSVFIANTHYSQ